MRAGGHSLESSFKRLTLLIYYILAGLMNGMCSVALACRCPVIACHSQQQHGPNPVQMSEPSRLYNSLPSINLTKHTTDSCLITSLRIGDGRFLEMTTASSSQLYFNLKKMELDGQKYWKTCILTRVQIEYHFIWIDHITGAFFMSSTLEWNGKMADLWCFSCIKTCN